jgi:uncharacterized protein
VSEPLRRALITGASAGIGETFTRHLADRGAELVVVARRRDRLEALAAELPVDVEVLPADLLDPQQRARVEARLAATERPVDLLVNNAGFGAYGSVADLEADVQAGMVDLNVTTLVRLTRAVLPQLLARGTGGVINVGSIAGYQPDPYGAVYGATKAFVRSFSEALTEELRGTGVHALLLAPGITPTEFQEVAGVRDGLPSLLLTTPDVVVDAALTAFARRRSVCVPGPVNRLSAYGSQVAPSAVSRRVSGELHRRFAR